MSEDDRDTDPHGLTPPPPFAAQPPGAIPGAPEWAQALFRELHEGRADTRRVLRNQELSSLQFTLFRSETRSHLQSHDAEIEEIRADVEHLLCRVDQIAARCQHDGGDRG